MKNTVLANFAKRLAMPDLSLMPEGKLTPERLRIEVLAGLTVAYQGPPVVL